MRTRSLTGMLVLLLAAGCGGGGTVDAVAWTGEVCTAISGFADAAMTPPQLDVANPVAAVSGLGAYLGSTSAALDSSLSRLDAAGPSPVEGGDEYVTRLRSTLTQIRASFATARTELAGVDTSSVQALTAALPAVIAPLQELSNVTNPTVGLGGNDELRAALEQAPSCRRLLGTAG